MISVKINEGGSDGFDVVVFDDTGIGVVNGDGCDAWIDDENVSLFLVEESVQFVAVYWNKCM